MSDGTVNAGAADVAPDQFVFVEMPDGSVRAVDRGQVQKFAEFQSDGPVEEDPDPEVYVHFANGEVSRLHTSELIEKTGSATPQYLNVGGDNDGGWYAHKVIGIYPVEVKTTSKH